MLRQLRAIFGPAAPTPSVPATAEQLAVVAEALRRAGVAPDAAAAGFLWATKDARRARQLVADLARR